VPAIQSDSRAMRCSLEQSWCHAQQCHVIAVPVLLNVAVKEQTMTKCAHPSCKCQVAKGGSFGEFCSEHCQEAAKMTELRCDCKHAGCQ